MKVYGALESAQIEWFTNTGKPAASSYPYRVIYVTDLKQIQVSDGTNWNPSAVYSYTVATLPAAGASNNNQIAFITDTLQVKVSNGTEWKTIGARLDTFTSGTIPVASSNTNSLIWVSDLQQVQVSNGTSWVQVGSKAGTKNYFSQNNANPDFETNSVTPWSACTLTFSSGVPSGAPTLTAIQMAISTTSTTPLAGTYSMLLTKSAANAQYQGFISGALTIDREDTAKVLYGSFNYELVSGTIDLSGSSTQSLEIWIYNTVSGAWTQPAGYRGMNQSSGAGKVVFSFQTDGTFANNTYKIAVFTQQTSATAYTVKFDDFAVGPTAILTGAVVTDFQTYTPTVTYSSGGATNVTHSGRWRRVGDSVELEISSTFSGASAVFSRPIYSLPAGLVADTSKMTYNTTIADQIVGTSRCSDSAANAYIGQSALASTTTVYGFVGNASTTYTSFSDITNAIPFTFGAADGITVLAKVPIQGWSSNVQTSSDSETRVVAAQYINNTAIALTADVTNITFLTQNYDTSASWNGSTFTASVSGYYQFQGMVCTTVSVNIDLFLWKDSVKTFMVTQNRGVTSAVHGFSGSLYLNAGQIVNLRSDTAATLATSTTNHFININRLSGPSVITATESVNASYNITAAASTADVTQFNFDNKQWDSHMAVTTGAGSWKFTAPISGIYSVSSTLYCGLANSTIALYKNGSIFRTFFYPLGGTATGCLVSGTTLVQLNAGDYIDVRNISGSARTPATTIGTGSTLANSNYVTINRVGN